MKLTEKEVFLFILIINSIVFMLLVYKQKVQTLHLNVNISVFLVRKPASVSSPSQTPTQVRSLTLYMPSAGLRSEVT